MEQSSSREALAIFEEEGAFRAAIDKLREAGFPAGDISFLTSAETLNSRLGDSYAPATQPAGPPEVCAVTHVVRPEAAQVEAAIARRLFYVGTLPRIGALAASGGAFAAAVAAAQTGEGDDGLLCDQLSQHMEKRHLTTIVEQLAQGAILLWVQTRDEEAERKSLAILRQEGGQEVMVHSLPAGRLTTAEETAVDRVDEELRQTFPASDPPSFIAGKDRG